ncbi:MAG: hypothetical protein Q7U38_11365, partial [Methylobacter sp.]|nr:hypothetical protein [Methylobacter sp.]
MMWPKNKVGSEATDLPVITGKDVRWVTYAALAMLAVVGVAATLCQGYLDQLLGNRKDIAILAAAALILIACDASLMRIAGLKQKPQHLDEAIDDAPKGNEALESSWPTQTDDYQSGIAVVADVVERHLCLDEAMDIQLKKVMEETESAAIMLITEVRTLNDAAN